MSNYIIFSSHFYYILYETVINLVYQMHLYLCNSFAELNDRYNINQNIDSKREDGSALYPVFIYICSCSKNKKDLIQKFYMCIEFSINSYKPTH